MLTEQVVKRHMHRPFYGWSFFALVCWKTWIFLRNCLRLHQRFVDASLRRIRHRIIPDFWAAFPKAEEEEEEEGEDSSSAGVRPFGRRSLPAPFEKSCLTLLHGAVGKMHDQMHSILAGAKLIDDLGAARSRRCSCEALILETLLGIVTTRPKLTLFPIICAGVFPFFSGGCPNKDIHKDCLEYSCNYIISWFNKL